MFGGFSCSKNTLLGLNIGYVMVAFLLIGVATYGKSSSMITSLPILGGIVASGVFLLFVAVLGLIATMKHHQIMLFFYMLILFLIFIIQFSVACAALAVDEDKEMKIVAETWKNADDGTLIDIEKAFGCCGFATHEDRPAGNCTVDIPACASAQPPNLGCPPCKPEIQDKINSAFNASGGLGLFFAFTEIIGAVLAYRYRNLMDPMSSNAATNLFP